MLAAMEAVTRDIYAASTLLVMAAKLRTIRKFLACWNLPLVPYTPEVVHALGAALKWRGYRSADLYLYQSRAEAEREGAVVGPAARRALTDVIRSCRRGIVPAKHCEGLVLELLPDLAHAGIGCLGDRRTLESTGCPNNRILVDAPRGGVFKR